MEPNQTPDASTFNEVVTWQPSAYIPGTGTFVLTQSEVEYVVQFQLWPEFERVPDIPASTGFVPVTYDLTLPWWRFWS